jgi:maltose-binding protein MalE
MKKKLMLLALIITASFVLIGCSRNTPLVIWVGTEVQEFYQEQMDRYVILYEEIHNEPFPYTIEVRAADTGTAAGTFLDDMDAGPDILTVAHDNLGRLLAGAGAIRPIQNPALIAQIESENSESFNSVIRATVQDTEYIFGVPYEAQSLILYYNTKYLSPSDVETWEGILAVAAAQGKRSLSITGTDGFNNSFLVLATNAQTGERLVDLYENGVLENTKFVTDGMVSVLRWGQDFFTNPNGARQASDSGWSSDLETETSLTIIGGAWHFRAAQAALGSNLGVAKLPRFTVTEAQAYGSFPGGTVMQSGSFTDTKMFVMNRSSDKLDYLEDILLFLSSKEMQQASFLANSTLPAYKNALTEFEGMSGDGIQARLTLSQIEMFSHGIPQPFGREARFNVFYYQRQAPDRILEILRNPTNQFNTVESILTEMEAIERIWLGFRD